MKVDLFIKQIFYLFFGILILVGFSSNIEALIGEKMCLSWLEKVKPSLLLDLIAFITLFLFTAISINNCKLQEPNKTITLLIILIVGFYSYERFVSQYFAFTSFKITDYDSSQIQIAYFDIIYCVAILHLGLYFKYLDTKVLIKSNNTLLEDAPIQLENEDKLKGLFNIPTEKIYKIINENKFESSFSIGLNSEWGDGKTSVFNLIRNKLKNHDDLIIVDFNPWIGFDKKVLIKDFFSSLEQSLGSSFHSEFSEYISLILNNGPENSLIKILQSFVQKKDESIISVFNEINEKIARLDKKIVVFIDDVDRLDKEEVFEILKLIRKTANFKNTFFVVAYDRNYVNNSIQDQSGTSTIKYLDKIINVEISLPYFDKYVLKEYFTETLKKVIPEKLYYKIDYIDQKKLEIVDLGLGFGENDLFEYWLNNFREIKKLVNSISVNYYSIYAQVNFTDLILLEILKLKHPQLYKYLFVKQNELLSVNRSLYCYYLTPLDKVKAANKQFEEFLESRKNTFADTNIKKEKTITVFDFYLEKYVEINNINDIEKERIIDLIDRLFLRWDGNKTLFEEYSNDAEQDLRVRFVNKYERYFSHTIFNTNISEDEFLNFLNASVEEIDQKLAVWVSEGKLNDLCFRLNRNFQYKEEAEYKNTILTSFKILEIEDNGININQLISKMFGLQLYPDIFIDKASASSFFSKVFSLPDNSILNKAQILNELKKKNSRRFSEDDPEKFPLTDEEIDLIFFSYITEKINSDLIFNNEFWSLYFTCQKVDENKIKVPFEEVNTLLHNKLKSNDQQLSFLRSLIIYQDYGYESVLRKGAIENLFGSMDAFEKDFLKKLPEDKYITEFIKYFDKSREEDWKHIEFDYEFIKQSISK